MWSTTYTVRCYRLHIHQVPAAGADAHTRLTKHFIHCNVSQQKIADAVRGIIGIITTGGAAVFIEDTDCDSGLRDALHAVQPHLCKVEVFLARQTVRLQVILNSNGRCAGSDAVALMVEFRIEVNTLTAVLSYVDIGV